MQYATPCGLSREQPGVYPGTHRVPGTEAAPIYVQIPSMPKPFGEQVRAGSPLLVMSPSRAAGAVLLRRDRCKPQGSKSLEDARMNQKICFLVVLASLFAAVGWALASLFTEHHGRSGYTEGKEPILILSRQQLALHHRKNSISGPQHSKDKNATNQTAATSVSAELTLPNSKQMTSARGRHFKDRSRQRAQTCKRCGSKETLRRPMTIAKRTATAGRQSIDRSNSLHPAEGTPAPTKLTVVNDPRDAGGNVALDNDSVSAVVEKESSAGYENSSTVTDINGTFVEVGNMRHEISGGNTAYSEAEGASNDTVASYSEK